MPPLPEIPHRMSRSNQLLGFAAGHLSNGGKKRYLLEAESTTGFVAWKLADGTILVSGTTHVSIKPTRSVSFWACAGYRDTTPAGKIVLFDCHDNALTKLDVRGLTGLEFLDCSNNRLSKLPLDGLTELEALDADNNHLTSLAVRHLHALRVLNCAGNRLTRLDLSGMSGLQILDCSGNPIKTLKLDGCDSLQEDAARNSRSATTSFRIPR